MKSICLLFIVFCSVAIGQAERSLKASVLNKKLSYDQPLKITLTNETQSDIFFIISLDKKNREKWVKYCPNVFTRPFSKGNFPDVIKALHSKNISVLIPLPSYFISKNGQIYPAVDDSNKVGVFRPRIQYDFKQKEKLDHDLILPEIKISKLTVKQ